jgi:hypothetical protein
VPWKYKYPTTAQLVGDYGSIADWSRLERATVKGKGSMVPVQCGVCGVELKERACVILGKPHYQGLHKECFLKVRPLNTLWIHEEMLSKGTKVLFHKRALNNRHKVGIECRGCFKETGQVKYVGDNQIQNHIKGKLYWDELCSDCVRKRGRSLRKFTTAQTAPSGTVTHFENVVDGKVLVVYCNPDKGCGCERWVDRDTASSWWKRFPAVCRFHHNHPEAYAELLQARQTSGNKQGEGKPSGRKRQDRSQWLLEAINAVAELWHCYESLPHQKRIDCITQEDLAPLLGFGGGDPTTIAKQVYNRLKDCGLREMFPGVRSWFNSFVETVADEIERDTDPQTILARLMQRRDRTAA